MAYFFPLMNKGFSKYSVLYFEDLNYITHVQKTIELLICAEGQLYVTIADKTFLMKKGAVCLIMDNTPHSYFTPKDTHSLALGISLYEQDVKFAFKQNNDNSFQDSIFCYDEKLVDDVILLSDEIFKLDSYNSYQIVLGLSITILSIVSFSPKKEYIHNDPNNVTINYVLQYIIDNIFKTQSLDKVASDLSFSKFYISRLFSDEIFVNYKKYVNALRMSGAKRLLVQTDYSVADIAKECSFDSPRTFNREFVRYFGLTPSAFRKLRKNEKTIDVNSPYALCAAQYNKIVDND